MANVSPQVRATESPFCLEFGSVEERTHSFLPTFAEGLYDLDPPRP